MTRNETIRCERCDRAIVLNGRLMEIPYSNVDDAGTEHYYCGTCVHKAVMDGGE